MNSTADAFAVLERARIYAQHQVPLTLLNSRMQRSSPVEYHWLDLGCGKGQIISQLEENMCPEYRARLHFVGIDHDVEYLRTAGQIASRLKLGSSKFHNISLDKICEVLDDNTKFQLITFTNSAHELATNALGSLLFESIVRLASDGELYLHDMENLKKLELGALTWKGYEVAKLVNSMLEVLEVSYRVNSPHWKKGEIMTWSIVVQRDQISCPDEELIKKRTEIIQRLECEVDNILIERQKECNELLNAFYLYGTADEEEEIILRAMVYEFWALKKIEEMRK